MIFLANDTHAPNAAWAMKNYRACSHSTVLMAHVLPAMGWETPLILIRNWLRPTNNEYQNGAIEAWQNWAL